MGQQSRLETENARPRSGVTLMPIVLLLALPLVIAVSANAIEMQQTMRAIARIHELGGEISYGFQWSEEGAWQENAKPPGHQYLQKVFGEYYAADPVEIQLFAGQGMSPAKFTDADAKELSRLSELKWLVLQDTGLTDIGLAHFKSLKNLERLDIEGTSVTTKGVAALKESLPHLQVFH